MVQKFSNNPIYILLKDLSTCCEKFKRKLVSHDKLLPACGDLGRSDNVTLGGLFMLQLSWLESIKKGGSDAWFDYLLHFFLLLYKVIIYNKLLIIQVFLILGINMIKLDYKMLY